jgi:hypothetical protein
MEKIKPLHRTFASMVLITLMVGFSGCEILDRPEDTTSVMQSKSTSVAYHQRSGKTEPEQSGDQKKLQVAQKEDDTSLRRDPFPDWGPVVFPLW